MNPEIYRAIIVPSIKSGAFEPSSDCGTYSYCALGKHCQDAARIASDLPPNLSDLSAEEAASCQKILSRSCCSHPQVEEVRKLAEDMMLPNKNP